MTDETDTRLREARELIFDAKHLTQIAEFASQEIQMGNWVTAVDASRLGGGVWAIAKAATEKLDRAYDLLDEFARAATREAAEA